MKKGPVTALVTGGSRGIGAAISLALASAGFNVAVNYLNSRDQAEKVVREAESKGVRAMAVQGDVSDPAAVTKVVSSVYEKLGPVGILVNNAGMAVRREIGETTEEDFDQAIRQNLKSSFLMTQAVLPGMREAGWGRIVMISSTAAQTGGHVGLHYAASKAGQLGMMHFYAARLGTEGITVNAIAPGLIDTDMLRALKTPDLSHSPLRRVGMPDEIADAVLLLVNNGYITNQTLNINGGLHPSG